MDTPRGGQIRLADPGHHADPLADAHSGRRNTRRDAPAPDRHGSSNCHSLVLLLVLRQTRGLIVAGRNR
ncbi:Uncharacterised protein [Mycobacterium tuberculosis]|nr:Uncharacterised protein [Mycobacterium tuberculosis]